MTTPLRWGILATGCIARAFAQGLQHSPTGTLAAVGSRRRETAERFGTEFGLPARACHASYEALLADEQVQAVYISNPHPGHAEWTIRCAEAGKHVLCEKPLAMNAAEAEKMVAAARRHGVFLMEAFMYRCHPQTAGLARLVREGAVGPVRNIQATFSFLAPMDPRSRLFDPALGGGGILDVGCYPASMARLIAGAAQGQPFAEPLEFSAVGQIGETGVDIYTSAVARFPGGILAQLSCGTRVMQDNAVRIYGEDGWIHVPTPWAPARDGGPSRVYLHRSGKDEPEEIVFHTPENRPAYLYTLEADHVAAHLSQGEAPAMSWADSLGNMRLLDRWRGAVETSCPPDQPVRGIAGPSEP